ncbi:glycosyltransferase [Marinimicrococcus flavescens]|uniref:Glycosyltransferase family A protein n=1 Tax=Marinimicrococcus flavescens TaxID=3031815 RepID=A0AAP4D5J5_9PROT|nr:glycosyltransferase family A protein [Marinimicrococcus flavescens]
MLARPAPRRPVGAVIAVPVRDEARRLPGCLAALAAQRGVGDGVEVLLLLNNCADASLEVALGLQARGPLPVSVAALRLEGSCSHVGWARRLAMDAAARRLREGGSVGGGVLTTDADSRAEPQWLEANLRAVEAGADAVAGVIVPDPAELGGLCSRARRRLRRQQCYDRLLERLASLLDPEPHDPWPRHGHHCGASMAARLAAYEAVGGLPPVPSSEDRAFFELLRREDGRIRHCPRARVVTSCRLSGRAAGGMAETLLHWSSTGGQGQVEAALPAVRALALRARLRVAWCQGRASADLAHALRLPQATLRQVLAAPRFGQALEQARELTARLRPVLVPAAGLAREIRVAGQLLARLAAADAPDRAGSDRAAGPAPAA